MLNDLIALVAPASPALSKALSGPKGAQAVAILGRAVLEQDDASPDQLIDALKSGDPDIRLKISRAEADFQRANADLSTQLAEISLQNASDERRSLLERETLAASDRANARQRQQTTNDRTNSYLAFIVTIGFLLTILIVADRNYTGDGNPALQILLGILGTGWASMMAFYFGSSVGSREKTAILGDPAPPKSPDVTPQLSAGGAA